MSSEEVQQSWRVQISSLPLLCEMMERQKCLGGRRVKTKAVERTPCLLALLIRENT